MNPRKVTFDWNLDTNNNIRGLGKYSNKYYEEKAREIALSYFKKIIDFQPKMSGGNHGVYIIKTSCDKYLLRINFNITNDNYLLVEKLVIDKAKKMDIPAPEILAADISKKDCKYQISRFIEGDSINKLYKENRLHNNNLFDIGRYLRRLHAVKVNRGFGYFDIDQEGDIFGLNNTYYEFVMNKLYYNVARLVELGFINTKTQTLIISIFTKAKMLFTINEGSLIHRDYGFYNMLGSSTEIFSINDWSDSASGDPLEDLGVLRAHYEPNIYYQVLKGYTSEFAEKDYEELRIKLYTLRHLINFALDRINQGIISDPKYYSRVDFNGLSPKAYSKYEIVKYTEDFSNVF